jgi:Catalytic LigB subunit of aromatic ring-opening dioxygenase
VNCHIEPSMPGCRLDALGHALATASRHSDRRIAILVTGGLSGNPAGPMSGWVDDVLDKWVLTRIQRSQSADVAQMWNVRSRTLHGTSAEIRLWSVAATALELVGCRARILDYMPIRHAACGVAFVTWERPPCP